MSHAAKIKEIVEHPDTAATCLLLLCLDEWGTEFFEWEPDSLLSAVMVAWHAKMPEKNRDKLWSLVVHLTTNTFQSSFECFTHVCNALSGQGASFEQLQPANVASMCWGITEAFLVDAPEVGEKFNAEIEAYMSVRLEYEGFHHVPRVLKPYTSLKVDKEAANANMGDEGIEYASFWTNEEQKSVLIDEAIVAQLRNLFHQLEQLPLQHANQQSLRHILQRAKSVLAEQSKAKTEAQALVPQQLL